MKWYSIKKYKPSINGNYICRYKNSMRDEYEMASFEWLYNNFDCGYKVTHFAIPDPIEIEE